MSVRCDARCPGLGLCCVKSAATEALAHAASSSRPSIVGAALARVALELASDLRGRLGDPIEDATAPPAAMPDGTGPEHGRVWQALGTDATTMDELVARTGLTPADLSPILLAMELDGRMSVQHGRYFRMA